MSVNAGDLSNPERGQAVRNPEQGQRPLSKREEQEKAEEAARAQELDRKASAKVLRERLAAARELNPTPQELHWLDRWNKGRDEAVRVFEETEGTVPERLAAARALVSAAADGCRDCFERGRDAALGAIEGRRK
jgi:hypothetical protein